MLNNTKRIKEIYKEIQKKIFYAVPGKWDELYLYASIQRHSKEHYVCAS